MNTTPTPAPVPTNRLLRWADGLLYAGLGLTLLTVAVQELGMVTLFIIPCCLYLSWVLTLTGWPLGPAGWGRGLKAGAAGLAAAALLYWMARTGLLKSALVCGAEAGLALAWAWRRRGWARRAAGPGLALAGLWLGLPVLALHRTPLAEAVSDPHWATVLLKLGADPNEREPGGLPVLHFALLRGEDSTLVRVLLAHGADPNAWWTRPDGTRIEPASFGLFSGYGATPATFRRLLAAGLNPNLKDQDGETFAARVRARFKLSPADEATLAAAERRFAPAMAR